jgi:hypothetical protein
MPTLTAQQIKEIAEQLDLGLRSFWHKTTGALLFVPDFDNQPYAEEEFYEEELEELENNAGDYIEIERPYSSDSFEIMVSFTEQLDDNNKLKNKLINALNKKKPFREFMLVIDNSGVFIQQWFDFKNAQLEQWVIDKFNEATSDDRENSSQ